MKTICFPVLDAASLPGLKVISASLIIVLEPQWMHVKLQSKLIKLLDADKVLQVMYAEPVHASKMFPMPTIILLNHKIDAEIYAKRKLR